MIIGIDASKAAIAARTGVENFVYQIILKLSEIDHTNVYFLYTNVSLPRELKNRVNFVEKLERRKRFWNSFFLPALVRRHPCDAYIQPVDKIPFSAPKKSIAVVHDLAWKRFPEAYSLSQNIRQRATLYNYASKALKVVCVSASTRNDLVKYYPRFKPKTVVVPLGYDTATFHHFDNPRNFLKIDSPYILYVGRIEERKNCLRLIQAFVQLKNEREIPHKLILIGTPGHNFVSIYRLIRDLGEISKDIILPGYVDHAKLPQIIARADVFAFPSLYEGFGLAVLEAMACGVPLLTSKVSSLPEIVGDAALLCDPENVNDIAEKIGQFLADEKLRQRYSMLAIKQAEKFSWTKTVTAILDLITSL